MRHPVDDYKNWQPKFASYEINKFSKRDKQSQAIKEMAAEAGEVLGVLVKADRKQKEIPRDKLLDELGDTFWGLVGVMNTCNISFSELCDYNMHKLEERFRKEPEKWAI